MIRIVNWLLTRKCNLDCDYCAIVKNYHGKPEEYPDMNHYLKNEMDTNTILNVLAKFKQHNPNCFHIFYGGEPMLRKDLSNIIEFCHRHDIFYTIISNNTKEIQPLIKKLIKQRGYLKGYTASIDPILVDEELGDKLTDRLRKSQEGFEFLKWMQQHCEDVVAEITVLREDQHLIHKLVTFLSENGINSDITFVDIAKTEYYDFSNVCSESNLVQPSPELSNQMMNMLIDKKLNIHMKNYLIPAMYATLPSNMDCEIEKSLHNVSIDADGTVRLCLRIRGVETPKMVRAIDLLDSSGQINKVAHRIIAQDKEKYCKLCNHTCHLMSKALEYDLLDANDLVHLDRR